MPVIRINICPDCHRPMHRAGWVWSGRKQIQRYRCPECGRTTIRLFPLTRPPQRQKPVSLTRIDGVRLAKVRD